MIGRNLFHLRTILFTQLWKVRFYFLHHDIGSVVDIFDLLHVHFRQNDFLHRLDPGSKRLIQNRQQNTLQRCTYFNLCILTDRVYE